MKMLFGKLSISYAAPTEPGSMAIAYGMPICFANGPTCDGDSSSSTPRNTAFALNAGYCFTMYGSSSLHGPHQLAKKLMYSGLPLNCASEIFLPVSDSTAKAGAGLPTAKGVSAAASSGAHAAVTSAMAHRIGLSLMCSGASSYSVGNDGDGDAIHKNHT